MRDSEYTKSNHFWNYGDVSKLASISKMTYQTVSNILGRHKTIGKEKALVLEAASKQIGKHVPFIDWLFSLSTAHPAFYNPRKKSEKLKQAIKIIKNMNK